MMMMKKSMVLILSIILMVVIGVGCESYTETATHNEMPDGAVVVDIDGHQVIMLDGRAIGIYGDDIQWGLINERWSSAVTTSLALESVFVGMLEVEDDQVLHLSFDLSEPMFELFDFDHVNFNLPSPQEPLSFTVHNPSESDKNGLIKVFYNYEETLFRIEGSDEYVSEFVFQVPSGYEVTIPIQLYSGIYANDVVNSLIIGLFENPENYSMNGGITRGFATMVNLGISYGGNNELNLQIPHQKIPTQIEGISFRGVQINQDFGADSFEGLVGVSTQSPNQLRVYPGEVVEFAFNANVAGSIEEDVEEYLIISMLDWQQVDKNGQPFLLVEANYADMQNNVLEQGTFTVEMPMEPGFYEFVTFIVPAPTRFNENTFGFPLQVGSPFTIEVVAE